MTTSSLCCPDVGVARRDAAHALLADHREAVLRRAQRALLTVLLETGSANIDDVRELVELPPGVNPKLFGAAPGVLARAGIIYRHGYTPTCRPTAHTRPVTVWALLDRAKALRWLNAHPELPDPGDHGQEPGTQAILFPLDPENEPDAAVATAAPGVEA